MEDDMNVVVRYQQCQRHQGEPMLIKTEPNQDYREAVRMNICPNCQDEMKGQSNDH